MEEQSESSVGFGKATVSIIGKKDVEDEKIVKNIEVKRVEVDPNIGDGFYSIDDIAGDLSICSGYTTGIGLSTTIRGSEAIDSLEKWIPGDDWDRECISVSELDDTHCCPNCDREFNQPSWKPLDGFNHYGSIQWEYGCPTETCDTLIVVKNDLAGN